jgi:hypothetical protein
MDPIFYTMGFFDTLFTHKNEPVKSVDNSHRVEYIKVDPTINPIELSKLIIDRMRSQYPDGNIYVSILPDKRTLERVQSMLPSQCKSIGAIFKNNCLLVVAGNLSPQERIETFKLLNQYDRETKVDPRATNLTPIDDIPLYKDTLINKEFVREIFSFIKNPDEKLIWVSSWKRLTGFDNIAQEYTLNKSVLSLKHKWLQDDNLFLGTTSRIVCVRKKQVSLLVYSINYDRIRDARILSSWGWGKIKLICYDIPYELFIETADNAEKIVDQIVSECPPSPVGNIRPDIIG